MSREAFFSRTSARKSREGRSFSSTESAEETWIAEGTTSLLDWLMLTWSLGCTGRPRERAARAAITSLAFMLALVPEPVW